MAVQLLKQHPKLVDEVGKEKIKEVVLQQVNVCEVTIKII
jgi:hypothetical protein